MKTILATQVVIQMNKTQFIQVMFSTR